MQFGGRPAQACQGRLEVHCVGDCHTRLLIAVSGRTGTHGAQDPDEQDDNDRRNEHLRLPVLEQLWLFLSDFSSLPTARAVPLNSSF